MNGITCKPYLDYIFPSTGNAERYYGYFVYGKLKKSNHVTYYHGKYFKCIIQAFHIPNNMCHYLTEFILGKTVSDFVLTLTPNRMFGFVQNRKETQLLSLRNTGIYECDLQDIYNSQKNVCIKLATNNRWAISTRVWP